jgi:outer membrane protein OmpA-like peptidoglycan-associated protein
MRTHVIVLSALISGSLALHGCTTNPYTGESQTSKAGAGAVIGAVAGAAIGLATGDNAKERRKRALIGAGAGGLAGGGVGFYMDQQEAKLRQKLQGTGVSVTRSGDNIILNMPGNVTFKTASSDLNPSFFSVLGSVALVLKEFNKTLGVVAGHTDNVGADDYNQRLSEQRASTVATYLSSQGIAADRLMAVGYGETRPVASNDNEAGRAQNRRVELTLEPLRAQ